jgi:hypothetical protein
MNSVYCAVGTESLNETDTFRLQRFNILPAFSHNAINIYYAMQMPGQFLCYRTAIQNPQCAVVNSQNSMKNFAPLIIG